MEKKEQNYIRQLLLELEDYLFSLSWYDGEDRLKTFRDVSDIKSIFQLVPKRYLKLLEGKIYTQQELSKAREEGIKHLGTFTVREGDELCEVLKVGERYFRSWDLESYRSGIEEISKRDFKKLSKLKQ